MGFWEALETHSVLSQITVEWQRLFGNDYPSARFLLKPTETLASAYPCPSPGGPGCPRRIIEFDDDDIEAVCSDPYTSCGTLKLTRTDIIVYTIDWRRLAEHLARALKLDPAFQEAGHRRAWMGSLSLPGGQRVEVHLVLPSSKAMVRDVISDLVLREDLCLLLVPTRRHLDPESTDRLQRTGSRATHLNEIVSLCDDRSFESSFDLRRLFEPSPGQSVAVPGCVFQPQGEFWQLTFGGHSAQLKSIKGLFYLAALLRSPERTFSHLDLTLEAGEGAADTDKSISREDGLSVSASPEAGQELLDSRAIREYRLELRDLKSELEIAECNRDRGTAERLRTEINQIEELLLEGRNFDGRSRIETKEAKRLRDRVNRAITVAQSSIEKNHPPLSRHLQTALQRKDGWCYRPGIPVSWVTNPH